MKILAADDEPLALDMLTEAIEKALPNAEISAFLKPSQLLSFASENESDIAFLDINMRGMTGVVLAKKLKKANPNINIIFVTGYNEYTADAMAMHASGYIMKPVTKDKILAELSDLRYPMRPTPNNLITIKCFGNFEVYAPDGKLLHFERSRSKEVLAYLVYRAGSSCTTKEIAAALFEDSEYDKNQRGYIQKIVASMIQSLRNVGAESVIIKNFNSLAINTALVDCDYYKFAENDSTAIGSYLGEFMSQYSWAEYVSGYLEELFWQKKNENPYVSSPS